MPSYLTPSWSRPGPRRRSLLTGAAGAAGTTLLAGCSGSGDSGDGRPAADKKLRARAARDSAGLLRQYDAVLAAHAPLADRLRPLRAEVARHEKAFGGTASRKSPGSPRPEGSPTSRRPGGSPAPVSVPDDPRGALRFLAAAERELAGRRGKELVDAPAELARLLASVAAAGAAHAYLLTEDDK
ncbi:hypothetical protein ABT390_36170 [Streptomyces aurantiacus]|uniref:Lipoprotein n=1 Tax=Streptomyces aurantiacus JA 4570 TaxID=1286094 RepID=S3ZEJ7_9ACTN|nr:hypothetical protein [Streptomyces aurantiacus]EPH42066.1 hypothetical protein STRAU_4875 [Streptomyces aurantiacus JA 4570]